MSAPTPKEVIEQILAAVGEDANAATPILVGLRLAGYAIVPKDERQRLVDIVFSAALAAAASGMESRGQSDVAEWAARQLRECGFDTEPRGMSWGVLKA
jgi:hypothetical protein